MKKANKNIIILITFIIGFQLTSTNVSYAITAYPPDLPYHPQENSRVELYQDILISLLMPYILKETDNYYSKYFTDVPAPAPYTVYVLSAERLLPSRSFLFRLKLRVISYIGPHLGVGKDNITLTVNAVGEVKVEKFEHIESYKLPPNYENIIKKGYSNPIP